jgi:hypothetical protein
VPTCGDVGNPRGALEDITELDRTMEGVFLAAVNEAVVRTQVRVFEHPCAALDQREAGSERRRRDKVATIPLIGLAAHTGGPRVLADLLPAHLIPVGRIAMTDTITVEYDGALPKSTADQDAPC